MFTGVFLKLFTPGFLFSRVKIGVFVHAHFHARFFCRDCSRVTFRFTGAFLRIVHGWVVKVSREKKNTDLLCIECRRLSYVNMYPYGFDQSFTRKRHVLEQDVEFALIILKKASNNQF